METTTPTMEQRLAHVGAGIDRLLAKGEHSDFVKGLKHELSTWREWMDEARVQSALGSMEARDRVAALMKKMEQVHAHISEHIDDLEASTDPVPGLRAAVERELSSVRQELPSAGVVG